MVQQQRQLFDEALLSARKTLGEIRALLASFPLPLHRVSFSSSSPSPLPPVIVKSEPIPSSLPPPPPATLGELVPRKPRMVLQPAEQFELSPLLAPRSYELPWQEVVAQESFLRQLAEDTEGMYRARMPHAAHFSLEHVRAALQPGVDLKTVHLLQDVARSASRSFPLAVVVLQRTMLLLEDEASEFQAHPALRVLLRSTALLARVTARAAKRLRERDFERTFTTNQRLGRIEVSMRGVVEELVEDFSGLEPGEPSLLVDWRRWLAESQPREDALFSQRDPAGLAHEELNSRAREATRGDVQQHELEYLVVRDMALRHAENLYEDARASLLSPLAAVTADLTDEQLALADRVLSAAALLDLLHLDRQHHAYTLHALSRLPRPARRFYS